MKTAHIVGSSEDDFDMDLIRSFPRFEPAEYLDSEEAIVGFVNIFLEEGDPSMLVHALETVAQAPGIVGSDATSQPIRDQLLAALGAESDPSLHSVMRVMKSLGLRLVAEPICKPVEDAKTMLTPDEHTS